MGEGVVENLKTIANVVYGWSLCNYIKRNDRKFQHGVSNLSPDIFLGFDL